jgi:hypothetical protein
MGHPKRKPAGNVLTPSFPRSPQQDDRLIAEDLAVMRIAERFAPGVQSLAPSNEPKVDHPAPRSVSTLRIRALVAVLIVVALLPSLVLGAMLWLGLIGTRLPTTLTFGHGARPSVQSAAVAGVPFSAGAQSGSAEVLPVALAAPAILEAEAGEDTPFALALSYADGLPARSTIAIHGLPRGSTLSSGRPYGEGGWNLRSDEIGGLRLVLPEEARGEAKLGIRLITPRGEDIARAQTLLKVTPKPESSEPIAAPQHNEHQPNEGVRPFTADAIERSGYDAMLALGATNDAVLASRGSPEDELAQAPTADPSRESPSNTAAAKPDNKETMEVEEAASTPAQSPEEDAGSWVTLLAFVNLREGPSSSRPVIGVMDKGSKLRVIGRRRAWLKVTDAANSQTGWIYSRYAYSATMSRRAMRNVTPSRLSASRAEPESDGLFWARLGEWIVGPGDASN